MSKRYTLIKLNEKGFVNLTQAITRGVVRGVVRGFARGVTRGRTGFYVDW